MPEADFVLVSRRVVTPAGTRPAAIVVSGGIIRDVLPLSEASNQSAPVIDAGDLAVLPGLVDVHVHINEPGRTEWEGFETATRAAAAGGVTTLVDMPLNSTPVTTTIAALQAKRSAAEGRCHVDVGFHGGLIPGNLDEIEPMIDVGVLGIKAFLVHSGIDDFPNAGIAELRAAMPILARCGIPLLVHAEWDCEDAAPSALGARRYADYLASRPPVWETRALEKVLALCAEFRCPLHIVHLSAAEGLPLLRKARAAGLPVTVETAPHYLYFAAEQIPDGGTVYKCAPPIRSDANREQLWQALRDGEIDLIATDHSPCPPAMKRLTDGDFGAAWGGISSLQSGLSAVWTQAQPRGFTLDDIARWMSAAPARSVGLHGKKGVIAPGADADLILFDPDAEELLTVDALHYRHRVSPYIGETLKGRVVRTYLRGETVFEGGVFGAARGVLLRSVLPPLNALSPTEATETFRRCCGSSRWAESIAAARPFASLEQLEATSEAMWPTLDESDWHEAFSHHPKIGDIESLRSRFAETRAWAGNEQSGTAAATEETLRALASGNAAYEARFGYIFIVCATGKSANEMLVLLEARLGNDPAIELPLAAEEQKKITRLRLRKLIDTWQ